MRPWGAFRALIHVPRQELTSYAKKGAELCAHETKIAGCPVPLKEENGGWGGGKFQVLLISDSGSSFLF